MSRTETGAAAGAPAPDELPWQLIAALVAVFLLWMATESSGQNWGGDFSQYIHHAINLAQGLPYADIGYIQMSFAYVGPDFYPPLFPLLLVPVYLLFGLDWYALKLVPVASFCVALYFMLSMTAGRLSRYHQFALIVVLALNPYFWTLKDNILSDYPFLLFCSLTLAVLDRRYVREAAGYRDRQRSSPGFAVLLGLLLYLCYATREIGLVMLPVVLGFELFHFRKLTLVTCAALLLFLALAGVQHASIKAPELDAAMQERIAGLAVDDARPSRQFSHTDLIDLKVSSVLRQALRYAIIMRSLWPETPATFVQGASWTAFILAGLFALGGYIRALMSGPRVAEFFVAGYLAVLLLFGGYQGLRYLLPVLPLFFYYAFSFHDYLLTARYRKAMAALALLFVGTTAVCYGANIDAYSYERKLTQGITSPDAVALFRYIDESTPPDSVVVFQKPRVLTLLTGREASSLPFERYQGSLSAYLQALGAEYLVVSDIDDSGYSHPLRPAPPPEAGFTLAYHNSQFRVYRLSPRQTAPASR